MTRCKLDPIALAGGPMTPELRAHLKECPYCNEAVTSLAFMKTLSARSRPAWIAPVDPNYLWLKARILRNELASEDSAGPIRILDTATHAIVALGWALLVLWKGPELTRWLRHLELHELWTGLPSGPFSPSFLIGLCAMLMLTSVVTFHWIVAEE